MLLWLILLFYDFCCFLTFIYIYIIYTGTYTHLPLIVWTRSLIMWTQVWIMGTRYVVGTCSVGTFCKISTVVWRPTVCEYRTNNCPHMRRVCLLIPLPTQSSGRRYSVFQQSFFLSFSLFSFANGSPRWLYRQGTFIAQKVGYRYHFISWVQNFGATPTKIWGQN